MRAACTGSLLLLAVLGVGCSCDRSGVSQRYAELAVVIPGPVEGLSREATVALPDTAMGERSAATVRIRNVGVASAQLQQLSIERGSTAFAASLPSQPSLAPGEEASVEVTFDAPLEGDVTAGAARHEAVLLLTSQGTPPDESELRVGLATSVTAGDCALPARVDFGALLLDSTLVAPVALSLASGEQRLELAGLEGADAAAFSVDAPSLQVSAPGGAARVALTVREARRYAATLRWRRAPRCPWANTELVGEGSSEAVSVEPDRVDFGDVPLQQEASRQVLVRSRAAVALPLAQVTVDGAGFRLGGTAPAAVPARGAALLDVRCQPEVAGALTGTLRVTLAGEPQRLFAVALSCRGGGPRLRLSPSGVLAFGVVPYVQGRILPATRRLLLQNVGNPAPAPNLFLGRGGGQLPYFAFVPVTGPTTDWQVQVSSRYQPQAGIPAVATSAVELTVVFQPTQFGRREVDLLVYSNDAVEPVTKLRLSADGRASDGCTLAVQPRALDFGPLPPGAQVTQVVTVRNTSAVDCSVSAVEVVNASGAAFDLSTPPAATTLRAGQDLALAVRARVGAGVAIGTALEGSLRLNTSDATQLSLALPLSALVATCVVLSPSTLNFGTTRPGCRTAARTAYLYNVCGVAVMLTSLGPTPPSFASIATLGIPTGGLALAAGASPRSVQLAYAPTAEGAHAGSIDFGLSVAGTAQVQTLRLVGQAANEPLIEETFTQPAVSKTDILLTIDDSCSMADEQAELAANLNSFLGYATSRGLDFQLGVTTTDDTALTARGRLLQTPTNPKVLRWDTPQLTSLFAAKVQVGTGGSGQEMPLSTTMRALTPPLSDGANAGLLRDDAALGIIIVTDAVDQSLEPISTYVDRILGVKGDARRFLVSVNVVGPFSTTAGCSTEGSVDNGRFRTLVEASGGVRADICTANWARDLTRVAEAAFGARASFPLVARPDVSRPLTVTVNGQAAPDAGFDAPANAVDFGGQPPPPGATISVRYTAACL